MSDPRNVAHAKKVTQEKHHHQAQGKPGKEKKSRGTVQNQPVETAPAPTNAEAAKAEQKPGDLEKSQAVLSKLKDLEFHSRANIETLAELSLTIEEELKQREFAEAIGATLLRARGFSLKDRGLHRDVSNEMREPQVARWISDSGETVESVVGQAFLPVEPFNLAGGSACPTIPAVRSDRKFRNLRFSSKPLVELG